MYTILIVEDDPKIAELLRGDIEKYGYEARVVQDFDRIAEQFRESGAHLVLLDVNLPKYDGFYWCRQIRAESVCPILFISARDGQMDQVRALESGADDYITKPFHYEIVLAKIRSHLRRAYGEYAAGPDEKKVEAGGLTLYPERFLLSCGERSAELSRKESLLIEALMLREGRVVSRDRLLGLMWEDHHFIDDNTLNVYITRMRKKLKELGAEAGIEVVRGAGYLLSLPEGDEEAGGAGGVPQRSLNDRTAGGRP
ncbi:response regulator transcription factor [Saccharibacillus alkalitolerans]|uniref:Response regulator transcription factor n=1 Tax=Saccharibacillus alkalitolerans TaxID=2705290 RepID=A0ABX0FB60_9BACL|nr:response regulator transcription factor [Saccharibacillus alkalitolerans]NGZ76709.1 response regulator transcription factor [Saccharibacillus alkalitolerans]